MYLRNWWYCAAVSDELGTAPLGRLICDEPVVLYRKADGGVVALEDRCCHRRAPLSKGKVEGDSIKGTTERDRNGQVVSRDWEAKKDK